MTFEKSARAANTWNIGKTLPATDGNLSGTDDPLVVSIIPRQPIASKKVKLLTSLGRSAASIAVVQAAPNRVISRASTSGGNSELVVVAFGKVATGLKRGLSVIVEITNGLPGYLLAAAST